MTTSMQYSEGRVFVLHNHDHLTIRETSLVVVSFMFPDLSCMNSNSLRFRCLNHLMQENTFLMFPSSMWLLKVNKFYEWILSTKPHEFSDVSQALSNSVIPPLKEQNTISYVLPSQGGCGDGLFRFMLSHWIWPGQKCVTRMFSDASDRQKLSNVIISPLCGKGNAIVVCPFECNT